MSTVAGGGGGTLYGYVDGVGAMARFNVPQGVSSLSTGDLVVADTVNNIIRRITSPGTHPPFKFQCTFSSPSSSVVVIICVFHSSTCLFICVSFFYLSLYFLAMLVFQSVKL